MEEGKAAEPAPAQSAVGEEEEAVVSEGVPEEFSVEMLSVDGEKHSVPVAGEPGINIAVILEAQVFKDWVADIDNDPKLFVRSTAFKVSCSLRCAAAANAEYTLADPGYLRAESRHVRPPRWLHQVPIHGISERRRRKGYDQRARDRVYAGRGCRRARDPRVRRQRVHDSHQAGSRSDR